MSPILYTLVTLIRFAVSIYTFLIFIRVVSSWFPNLYRYGFFRFVAKLVDPYLNLFRRWIPPIGGVLDLSPLLAFFALQIVEQILIRILL